MITAIIGKESLLTKHLKIQNKKNLVFSSRNQEDIENIVRFINSSRLKMTS